MLDISRKSYYNFLHRQLKKYVYPLFRVMEIQRICEVTATPDPVQAEAVCQAGKEGANLSE